MAIADVKSVEHIKTYLNHLISAPIVVLDAKV
jgi:hypothetical protein